MSTLWKSRYAQRTLGVKSSAIRELLKVTQKPEIISFGGGLPAPDVFPVKCFEEACHKVLTEHGPEALQYGTTEGYQPLREMIARNLARYGIVASAENVLITSGSQQALDLIGKLLINRGDRILIEAPTYLGALQAFNVYGAQYMSVPVDDDGLLTDQLDFSLRAGPKFMYVVPNFQNPAGVTLSEGRRHQLILLADKYGIPIVEDDPYGQLRYEGDHIAPLVVLDRENLRRDNGFTLGNVIYLSTFSKTLAPGIRLAWIVAPEDVIVKLVQLKQAADLHTSTFNQYVAYEVPRRLPRPARQADSPGLSRAQGRHASRFTGALPAGGDLDSSQGRPLSLGHDARGNRQPVCVPGSVGEECRLRARRKLLCRG